MRTSLLKLVNNIYYYFDFIMIMIIFFIVLEEYVVRGGRPDLSDYEIPDDYMDLMRRCWNQDYKKRPTFEEVIEDSLFDQFKF